MRGEEPQSYRDLALALAKRGQRADVEKALKLLYTVVYERQWDLRFAQIELTALTDAKRIYQLNQSKYPEQPLSQPFDNLAPFDVDLRVVLSWDRNLTDVDLIVIEPSGEMCYAYNNHTAIGGMLSRDFTNGYGPEEYIVRHHQLLWWLTQLSCERHSPGRIQSRPSSQLAKTATPHAHSCSRSTPTTADHSQNAKS